jgi:hypothetical protein
VNLRRLRNVAPSGSGLLLIPAAAFVVHQLRYTLAYGSSANAELSQQGHSYLHSLVPWLVLALGLGLSSFVRRAGVALRTGETGRLGRLSTTLLWAGTTFGLVLIYALQESLEELFASGHPTGLGGIFGHGGWWSVPAAALVAAAVVAILRIGRSILRAVATRPPRHLLVATILISRPVVVALLRTRPLALSAAGRAPPR